MRSTSVTTAPLPTPPRIRSPSCDLGSHGRRLQRDAGRSVSFQRSSRVARSGLEAYGHSCLPADALPALVWALHAPGRKATGRSSRGSHAWSRHRDTRSAASSRSVAAATNRPPTSQRLPPRGPRQPWPASDAYRSLSDPLSPTNAIASTPAHHPHTTTARAWATEHRSDLTLRHPSLQTTLDPNSPINDRQNWHRSFWVLIGGRSSSLRNGGMSYVMPSTLRESAGFVQHVVHGSCMARRTGCVPKRRN